MQLTKIVGVALVFIGLLVVFGVIPVPGEVALVVDGKEPTVAIYISDGTDYKLVAVNDMRDEKVAVTTSYNRIVVCYYDLETGVKSARFGYSRGQIPAPAYLSDAETSLPYRDAYMEYKLETLIKKSENIDVDVVCRYNTFSPSLGVRYGMRAQATDEADNTQDTWGWVYYGKDKIESYEIYFNGKKWDGSSRVYVKPGKLTIKVVIHDQVWIDSISYTLKDMSRNILEQKTVKVNIQAPDTIEWTTTTSLEKGKTYYLTITAKLTGNDYTLASIMLPLIDLTQAQIQNLMRPQAIIGILITAIGAILLAIPARKTA